MEEDPKREEEKRQQNPRQHRHIIGTAEVQRKNPRKTVSIDRRQGAQRQHKPDSITGQLFAKYILSE